MNHILQFERIHFICKKCSQKQITLYQISLKLHKIINELDHKFSYEHVIILNEIICSRRQITFNIFRNNRNKIGTNTTVNKLYHIKIMSGKAMTKAKGHEPMLYEAPFFRFTYVKMKGPNKPLNIKRTLNLEFIVNSYFINPVFMLNKSS